MTAAFIALYHHTLAELVKDWTINDNYSHGFFIPLITAYLIWMDKDELKKYPIQQNNAGFILIFLGMAFHVVGNIGAELFIMRFSMIVTLFGISLTLFGGKVARHIMIPLGYLIFMIPLPTIIWNKIAFPLQLLASKLSAQMIDIIGIPVFREGNILHLPNTSLEVVDACSGLRSLTSLLALSGAFAYIATLNKPVSKWILFFSAVPIAIGINIVRLTSTAVMAKKMGPEAAQGFLHEMSGLIVFVIALIFLTLVYKILSAIEKRISGETSP